MKNNVFFKRWYEIKNATSLIRLQKKNTMGMNVCWILKYHHWLLFLWENNSYSYADLKHLTLYGNKIAKTLLKAYRGEKKSF